MTPATPYATTPHALVPTSHRGGAADGLPVARNLLGTVRVRERRRLGPVAAGVSVGARLPDLGTIGIAVLGGGILLWRRSPAGPCT